MTLGFITDRSEYDFWFAKEHGLDLEVTVNPPFDALDALPSLLELQDKYGVRVASCGVWGAEHTSDDSATAEAAHALVPRLIDFAVALGAPTCCVGLGNEIEDASLQEHVDRMLPLLRGWIEIAEDKGVRLALYNCHWANWAYRPESWELIWGALGDTSLGLKYDPSHAFYDNRDYLEELLAWGDKVTHFHVKDTLKIGDRIVEDVPAGMGSIDYARIVGVLNYHGYTGCLSMEPHSGTWMGPKRYEGLLLSVNYMRQFVLT
ncbi:MAG: sugar phosphate isomerase/epimerase [Armatimonadetes bacterium]|nr:sugar phosphate isomerase/epimerase [Armatimonadota bacterium]